MESEVDTCGHLAHMGFRKKATGEGILFTSCYRERGHAPPHRYVVVFQGYNVRHCTMDVVEETSRDKLTRIIHADLKPGALLTEEEAQALGAFMDLHP